ncbi:MAG: polysaccharide deacetylase [Candidatus Bathyarchaeia archaeon]
MARTRAQRFTVLLTFDFDADSSVRGPYSGLADEPVARSKGQFGPKVGLPRILDLLDKYLIKSTFFVPGWTAETYPESVKEIVRRGHEVGVHGYKHENLAQLNSQKNETEILRKSLDRLQAIVGQKPVGFRAPDWEFSPYTIENLLKFNLKYDSSLMDDEKPYVIKYQGKPTGIVELPVSWLLDDWSIFEVHRRPPDEAFSVWMQEFSSLYAAKVPYFNLTMHPQTIGRASRTAILEALIKAMRRRKGVTFSRCIDLVNEVALTA